MSHQKRINSKDWKQVNMRTTMTLMKIAEELDSLDKTCTIYAAEPWMENSKAMVLPEPETGGLPLEAKKLGLKYFLEVFIAQNFVEGWAENLDVAPISRQKCLRLIQYAINDA
jgi:hypothetical protein